LRGRTKLDRVLRLIGAARGKVSVASFVLDDTCTDEVSMALSEEGIAVRPSLRAADPAPLGKQAALKARQPTPTPAVKG
jgi:hypothetical protein